MSWLRQVLPTIVTVTLVACQSGAITVSTPTADSGLEASNAFNTATSTAAPQLPTTTTTIPIEVTPPSTLDNTMIYPVDTVGDTVVYQYEDSLCMIHADSDPIFLTVIEGDHLSATISPDGNLVLFAVFKESTSVHPTDGNPLTYSEIWAINAAGGDAHLLTSTEQFAISYPDLQGDPEYWEWIPGTQKVAFSSVYPPFPTLGYGDIHLLDTVSGEDRLLVPPTIVNRRPSGWGSPLFASPDGRYIAYGTDSSLSLIGTNGENARRGVLVYDKVDTHGEYGLFALPTWASDSSGLWVTIPPTENESSTEVYFISASGDVRPVAAIPSRERYAFVSPDGKYVAYPEDGLRLVRLSTMETVFNFGDFTFVKWINGTQFILSTTPPSGPQYPLETPTHLANIDGTVMPIDTPSFNYRPCSP